MTEQEWMVCDAPGPLIAYLLADATGRKARLFGCGYLRQIWRELGHADACCEAVDIAERFADGQATPEELRKAWHFAWEAADSWCSLAFGEPVWYAVATADGNAYDFAEQAHAESTEEFHEPDIVNPRVHALIKQRIAARHAQWVRLLRDLLGNPFRRVNIEPEWLSCNNGLVRQLAQEIYAERAFERLPILADALEDAGCDNANILDHCRGGGEHVRGCWVLDLLLGKE